MSDGHAARENSEARPSAAETVRGVLAAFGVPDLDETLHQAFRAIAEVMDDARGWGLAGATDDMHAVRRRALGCIHELVVALTQLSGIAHRVSGLAGSLLATIAALDSVVWASVSDEQYAAIRAAIGDWMDRELKGAADASPLATP